VDHVVVIEQFDLWRLDKLLYYGDNLDDPATLAVRLASLSGCGLQE
jgi:hypothetical protein